MDHFKKFSQSRLEVQAKLLGLSWNKEISQRLPPLQFGKKGYATLERNGVFLHSKHDPVKEAERQIASLEIPNPSSLVFFFGAGLGYSLELFLKKHKNFVVWIEPAEEVLLLALGLADLQEAIKEGRLTILSPLNPKLVLKNAHIQEETLEQICKGFAVTEVVFFNHPASFRSSAELSQIKERAESWLNKKSVNLATLARFDRLWMHNLIRNFPRLLLARPIKSLFGMFPEKEAIVCGAGPSLSRDTTLLHSLRQGRLLIAVDTAYHVLLAHGLVADFVVCVDPQAINQYYLEPFHSAKKADSKQECFFYETNFVVDPTLAYLCLRHIPKDNLYFFESPFAMFRLLSRFLKDGAGEIAYGGSVSTNAYDLAIKLGCKKILLFGQDLSFPNKRAHATGATLEARLLWKENRFFRHEEHNYRQLSALPVRYLPGLTGQKVPTNDKLLIFHRWFEGRFSKDAKNIEALDLKSLGARFFALDYKKAQNYKKIILSKGPEKSVGTHLSQNADNIILSNEEAEHLQIPSKHTKPPLAFSKKDIEGFCRLVEKLKEDLQEIAELCQKAALRSQDCLQSKRHDKTYYENIKALDKLDQKIRNKKFSSEVAGSAIQRILFSITENFANNLTLEERSDPHLKSAKESLLLYEGLRKAALEIAEWLQKSLCLIRKL